MLFVQSAVLVDLCSPLVSTDSYKCWDRRVTRRVWTGWGEDEVMGPGLLGCWTQSQLPWAAPT